MDKQTGIILFWTLLAIFAVATALFFCYCFRTERRIKKVYRTMKKHGSFRGNGAIYDADVAINWIQQIQRMEDIPPEELTEEHIYILLSLYQGLYLYINTGSILHKPIAMPEEKLTRMLTLRVCFEKDNSFTFEHNRDTKNFYELLKSFVQEKQNFEYITTQEQNIHQSKSKSPPTPETKKHFHKNRLIKFSIWFLCLFVYSSFTTVMKMNGVLLGALPTVLLCGGTFWVADTLCKKWDEHCSPKYNSSQEEPQPLKKEKTLLRVLLLIIFVIAIIAILLFAYCSAEPKTGKILEGYEHQNASSVTVIASENESCVVTLKDKYKRTVISFYVRAGETVTIGVPCQTLHVSFASGTTWYGTTSQFGEKTAYRADSEWKHFDEHTYIYMVYSDKAPVSSVAKNLYNKSNNNENADSDQSNDTSTSKYQSVIDQIDSKIEKNKQDKETSKYQSVIDEINAKIAASETSTPEMSTLAPVLQPKTGTILEGHEQHNASEITVTASNTEDCIVKLKDMWGYTILSFYVRAGQTATVGVPEQRMYVYFALGKTWYGTESLFGADTSYSKDDDLINFKGYTWTYTLHPTIGGNFTETPINAEEFFD